MIEDQLMLNDDKTELMLIGTRQQLQKYLNDIIVSVTNVEVKSVARNLGLWFDRNLDMSFTEANNVTQHSIICKI